MIGLIQKLCQKAKFTTINYSLIYNSFATNFKIFNTTEAIWQSSPLIVSTILFSPVLMVNTLLKGN